jgi:CRP-like cAMP-binding protein
MSTPPRFPRPGPGGPDDPLNSIELFAGLPAAVLASIAGRCIVRAYKAEQQILTEDESTSDVFFVLSGTVRINSYVSTGREVIFHDIPAGGLFGEFSAIDGKPRASAASALSECRLARMTSQAFREVLRSNSTVAMRMMEMLVLKVRQRSERIVEASALTVRDRLRRELLRLAQQGKFIANGIVIQPAPTHYEMAARIGSHREAVTREFRRLETEKLIEARRGLIRIIDLARLEAIDRQ